MGKDARCTPFVEEAADGWHGTFSENIECEAHARVRLLITRHAPKLSYDKTQRLKSMFLRIVCAIRRLRMPHGMPVAGGLAVGQALAVIMPVGGCGLEKRWRWRVTERVRRVRPAPAPVSEIRIWLEERELESLEL